MKPDKWHLGGMRGPLHFLMTGFHLDKMPLGCSIGGKSKMLLKVLSTPLMLFGQKLLLELFGFLRIAIRTLQTYKTWAFAR